MKEEIEEKLIESLDKIGGWINNIEDSVINQTPLVVQELLNFHFYTAIMGCLVGIILIILAAVLIQLFIKLMDENGNIKEEDTPTLFIFFITVFTIVGFPIFFVNLYTIMYIALAPRLYALEQIKNLL